MTFVLPELDGKRLQLLREVAPNVSRIAKVLTAAGNPAALLRSRESRLAAEKLGVSLQAVEVASPFDFESASAIRQERADALLVTALLVTNQKDRKTIVELAAKHRLPTLYDRKEAVEAGGLMAYGPSLIGAYRGLAIYVDKILKGARPADLPMEQPTKFELAINLRTRQWLAGGSDGPQGGVQDGGPTSGPPCPRALPRRATARPGRAEPPGGHGGHVGAPMFMDS